MKTYYDKLFANPEGIEAYASYVKDNLIPGSVLELACGTGDVLIQLGPDAVGLDIDQDMLDQALIKYPELEGRLILSDFTSYKSDKTYDNLVCIGDSLNYLLDKKELYDFIDNSVKLSDHIILDSHHPYRLKEFEEPYFEEGSVEDFDYAYQISIEDGIFLVHLINFLDGTYDSVTQWVFDPQLLIERYQEHGYDVRVINDFDHEGLLPEGEKVRYIANKKRSL